MYVGNFEGRLKTFTECLMLCLQVYKMSGQGVDSSADNSLCSCSETRQLVGGKISKVLSRAALFSYSDDTDCMYAAVGDEASNSVSFMCVIKDNGMLPI